VSRNVWFEARPGAFLWIVHLTILFFSYFVNFLLLCFFSDIVVIGPFRTCWNLWFGTTVNIFNWISKVLSMFLERINGMSIGYERIEIVMKTAPASVPTCLVGIFHIFHVSQPLSDLKQEWHHMWRLSRQLLDSWIVKTLLGNPAILYTPISSILCEYTTVF